MDLNVCLDSPHSMGTTIIGVTYNGGVVLGADSRTSTGVYVANRASDKITQLTGNVYVCRSGSAADSQESFLGARMASISVSSHNLQNVFVYGSLLADEIVRALLNRVPQSSPAILHNYHRYSIKGRVYPAILPLENKQVTGRVLLGITPPELEVLDAFEDVEYERRDVELSLEDSSEKLHAYAYVWENKNDANLYGDWDFEAWKRDHLKDFAAMTKDFMKELEQPESKPRVATYEQFYEQDKQ